MIFHLNLISNLLGLPVFEFKNVKEPLIKSDGHKNRVHDLGRGSLNNQHSAMPTDQHDPEILYEDSGWHNLFIDFSIFLL